MSDDFETENKEIQATGGQDMLPLLVVYLTQTPTGALEVTSFDFPIHGAKLKLSFEGRRRLPDVFGETACEIIQYACRSAQSSERVLSFPDLSIRLMQCETSGLSLVRTEVKEGYQHLILRLRRLRGNAIALLDPMVLEDRTLASALSDAVEDAIQKIYTPLRNFDTAIESAMAARHGSEIERLHAQILAFKSEIEHVCFSFEQMLEQDSLRQRQRRGHAGDLRGDAAGRARLRVVGGDD